MKVLKIIMSFLLILIIIALVIISLQHRCRILPPDDYEYKNDIIIAMRSIV